MPRPVGLVCCLVIAGVLPGRTAPDGTDDARFVRLAPEDLRFSEVPGGGGLQMAVVEGDPTKPGIYVVRVKFPPGLMTRNHFHPEDRHAVVIEGTWWTGTGDAFNPDATVPLKTGSYMKHPAGGHHFDGAKEEEVIVQIIGVGPSQTILLRPAEGLVGPSLKQ